MYGDGSITYEKSRKRWIYDYYDNAGKRHRKRFKSKQEANAFKRETRHLKEEEKLQSSGQTVINWVIYWLKTYKEPNLRPSSYARMVQSAKHITPIADYKLEELPPTEVQTLYNELSRTLSTSSISKVHKLLNGAYKEALQLDMIGFNPMDKVTPPQPKQKEIEVLTWREVGKLFRKLRTSKYYSKYYLLFHLLIVTGCRIGELLALKWSDIDLAKREIHIRRNKSNYNGKIGKPKTKAGDRFIPIVFDKTIKLLADHQKSFGGSYVYETENGTTLSYYNIFRIWRKLGVTKKGLHSFRHTAATYGLEKGIPILEMSRILGHADSTTTLNMYGHSIPGYNNQIIRLFSQTATKSATIRK